MFQVTTRTFIAFRSLTGGAGAASVPDMPLNMLNPLAPWSCSAASDENRVLSLRSTECSESPRTGETGDGGVTCIWSMRILDWPVEGGYGSGAPLMVVRRVVCLRCCRLEVAIKVYPRRHRRELRAVANARREKEATSGRQEAPGLERERNRPARRWITPLLMSLLLLLLNRHSWLLSHPPPCSFVTPPLSLSLRRAHSPRRASSPSLHAARPASKLVHQTMSLPFNDERARAATPALGSPAPHPTYLYGYAALYASGSILALLLAVSYVCPVSTPLAELTAAPTVSCLCGRLALQVSRPPTYPRDGMVCHCQLGRVDVLSFRIVSHHHLNNYTQI